MLNFAFKNQTEILFGAGQVKGIASRLPRAAKVLMMYGGGSIKRNGVYDQVIAALPAVTLLEFHGIEPNPTYETLLPAVDLCRREAINFILAVGGGSVIDGAKFVAAAVNFTGDPWAILEQRAPFHEPLPIGVVLTLAATGSESNEHSVISRRSTGQKLSFSSTEVQPRFAVLDPEFTYSLPARQISNGIVDAFVHVAEQYLTYPVGAPLADRFAESILQTLIEVGPKALTDPDNYQHRANLMWSACMALNGLIGAGVPQDWATHAIGHELTALYGLDHAQTLAIVLPALLREQKNCKREKLLQLGERVFGIATGDVADRIEHTIAAVQDFFERVGVKTHLADYKIDDSAIEKVVASLAKNGGDRLGEHGDIDFTKVSNILQRAL